MLALKRQLAAGPFCPGMPAASSEQRLASPHRSGTETQWAARQITCRPTERDEQLEETEKREERREEKFA